MQRLLETDWAYHWKMITKLLCVFVVLVPNTLHADDTERFFITNNKVASKIESDPTLLPWQPVLLNSWPNWHNPIEFKEEVWVISGIRFVVRDMEPLARFKDGEWTIHSQPLPSPIGLAADSTGMLVAGDDKDVAIRKANETWQKIAPPVDRRATRDGVPGIRYSGGMSILAFLDSDVWAWDWQTYTWKTLKLFAKGATVHKLVPESRDRWFAEITVNQCQVQYWEINNPLDTQHRKHIRIPYVPSPQYRTAYLQATKRCRDASLIDAKVNGKVPSKGDLGFSLANFIDADGKPYLFADHRSSDPLSGRSGNLYWRSVSSRSINSVIAEIKTQPQSTVFVRRQKTLFRQNKGAKESVAIPYLPFAEWLREDNYLTGPDGPMQVEKNGTIYQIISGLKTDQSTIVKMEPREGFWRPVGRLSGRAEPFLLAGVPHWRVGSTLYNLVGSKTQIELPADAMDIFSGGGRDSRYAIFFSRTETLLQIPTGIYRYTHNHWQLLSWKQLGIREIEAPYWPAATKIPDLPSVQKKKKKKMVPEWVPGAVSENVLFLWSFGTTAFSTLEPRMVDLSNPKLEVQKKSFTHLKATASISLNTDGFVRSPGNHRKILFFDQNTVYETDDIWEGYWQGFLGFTNYFVARGHLFRMVPLERQPMKSGGVVR